MLDKADMAIVFNNYYVNIVNVLINTTQSNINIAKRYIINNNAFFIIPMN